MMRMNPNKLVKSAIIFVLSSVFFVLSTLTILTTLGQTAVAQVSQSPVAQGCSNATLLGTYGVKNTGSIGTQAPFTPFDAVASITFDGKDGFTASGYISVGGQITQTSAEGNYIVQTDCTFTADGTPIAGVKNSQFGVIIDGGREFIALRTSQGFNLISTGKRINTNSLNSGYR